MDFMSQVNDYVSSVENRDEIIENFNDSRDLIANMVEIKIDQCDSISTWHDIWDEATAFGLDDWSLPYNAVDDAVNAISGEYAFLLNVIESEMEYDKEDEVVGKINDRMDTYTWVKAEDDCTVDRVTKNFITWCCFKAIRPFGEKVVNLYRTTRMSLEAYDSINDKDE